MSKYFTQNIDGLERLAGLRDEKIVEAHGTFSSASCVHCKTEYSIERLREEIMADMEPKCPKCGNLVKPNIVFFGEQLPRRFFDEAEIDCLFSDLMICIGTSLEVYPFAGIFVLNGLFEFLYSEMKNNSLQELLTPRSTLLPGC